MVNGIGEFMLIDNYSADEKNVHIEKSSLKA